MKKAFKILYCLVLILTISVLAVACSEPEVEYANIKTVDVDERLRENDFAGFPIKGFNISQITLIVVYKDTIDENGNTIPGETTAIQASDYMIKAEDRNKLTKIGKHNITLVMGAFEINFQLRLYDEMEEKYTVTFFAEDGKTRLGEIQRVAEGGRAVQPSVPGKDNHTFVGWIDMDTGISATFDNIRKNTRLRALYESNTFIVTYCYKSDNEDKVIDEKILNRGEEGESYFPKPPVREGYEFVQWNKNSDNKFYAEYRPIGYTFSFVYRQYIEGKYVNGEYDYSGKYADSFTKKAVSYTQNTTTISLPNDYLPKNENSKGLSDANDYKFIYWYMRRGNTRIPVEFPITINSIYEKTFYAFYIDITKGSEELQYKKSGDSCIISGYEGDGGIVVIPKSTMIEGKLYEVTGIGDGVFKTANVKEYVVSSDNKYFRTDNGVLYNNEGTVLYSYPSQSNIRNYATLETTEEISPYAFYGAKSLESIDLNDSLRLIKDYAFKDCSALQGVSIAKNVVSIGEGAFRMNESSSISSISFEGTEIISLGDEAFYGLNSLKSLELPASLSDIGDGVFYGCSSLEKVDSRKNSYFSEYNGALYSVDYSALYVFPAKYVFENNPEVEIHPACKTISRGAFYFANISCITINSNLIPETYSIVCPSLRSIRIAYSGFKPDNNAFMQAFAEYPPEIIYVDEKNIYFSDINFGASTVEYYKEWNGLCDYYFGYSYSFNNDKTGIIIDGYSGTSEILNVPVMINDVPVVEIAPDAFNGNVFIREVELPVELTKIGKQAFMDCKSLLSVNITASKGELFSIGERAFYGCSSLTSFSINDGLEFNDFGEYVFDNTPILDKGDEFIIIGGVLVSYNGSNLSVKIPSVVKYIATDAFKDCGFITEISVESGSKLKIIDEYAFLNCSGIKQMIFPSSLEEIRDYSFYGCEYLYYVKFLTLQENVRVENEAFYQAGTFWGEEVCKEFVDSQKGTIYYHVGTELIVEDGVAFVDSYLPEISPSELFIGWYYEENYITRAEFPVRVKAGDRVDIYAFIKESSYVSDGLIYSRNEDGNYSITGFIGEDEHVVIGKTYMGASVTGISKDVFGETIVEITIPNELNPTTSAYISDILIIGIDAFAKTEWYKNYAGDFITYDNLLLAYKGDSKRVLVPDNVTILADGVFKDNKNIEYVKLPQSIKKLPLEIFSGCTSLKEVVLGTEVSQIENKAFAGCECLSKINFEDTKSLNLIAENAMDNTAWLKNQINECVIINGILYKYYGEEETLHIPSDVTIIADGAFKNNDDLVNLYLPSSLITIRSNAFYGAIALNSVYVPSENVALSYIMDGAFKDCFNLGVMDLSGATLLAEIGDSAFENCSSLKELFIPKSLIYLGEKSFFNSGLVSVIVDEKSRMDKIGVSAFENCRSLKSIVFNGNSSLITIGASAFKNCTSLERFENPLSEIAIFEECAMYNCQSLSNININDQSVVKIGKDAVYRLGYIMAQNKNMIILGNILVSYTGTEKIVKIPDNITLIYDSAFEGNTNVIEIAFGVESKLKTINDRAFFGCTNLSKILFPKSVDSVGYKMAEGTAWYKELLNTMEYIVINNTLVKYNIDYTRQAVIPEQVTKIIRGAFDEASVYDIKIGENVVEIEDGAFDGIIPAQWEESNQSLSGWTMTIVGDEPAKIGYDTKLENCVAIYLPNEESMSKFRLNGEWSLQIDLMAIIAKHTVSYGINSKEAQNIEAENVHALYNAKDVETYRTTSKQFVFVGWFKDEDFTEPIIYPYILTEDTTIYAKCIDYDEGSNPGSYILEDIEDLENGNEGYTIEKYLDFTDKNVVIITKQSGKNIYSVTGNLGYILYSGNDYKKYVYNEEEKSFEEYDAYGNYPEGTQTYRRNDVIEELSFANNCTIETLGENCFAGMTNLQKITIPSSVKYISSNAFADCENLREIIFEDGLENLTIETGAFRNCTGLISISIPEGVSTLGNDAFIGCISLREVYLESETPIVLYQNAMPFEITPSFKIYIPYGKKAVYSSSWLDYYEYLIEMSNSELKNKEN